MIVILADDLDCGDIDFYENPNQQTPHLDQLAREGVHLTQHYSCSPICGLDRMALREVTIADRL